MPSPAVPTLTTRCVHAALLLIVAIATASCRREFPREPLATVDPNRFPHGRHADLACALCHVDVSQETSSRPDDSHAKCDGEACHQSAFGAAVAPGASFSSPCGVCHVGEAGKTPQRLRPYPRSDKTRHQPSAFSHAQHLDRARVDDAVGFHVDCKDCHTVAMAAPDPSLPGHTVCTRCHAPESAPPGAPSMAACQSCHRTEESAPRRSRQLIRGDLHFDHRRHSVDVAGGRISCAVCHPRSDQATQPGSHPAPLISACVACHDDAARTPTAVRMRACSTCHMGRTGGEGRLASLSTLAPRNHLPATERPTDHTLAFRRDHGDEARADAARCAGCHTELSSSSMNTCDECHQVMRPADHRITWRELDHGPEALASSDRCATCHVVDYCVACHQQPPRSHLPLGSFGAREHGDIARVDLRPCLTCHQPERDCSPCHSLMGVGP